MSVAAIRAGDPVACVEDACETDSDGLLPGVEVGCPVDLAAEEEALNAILDAADHEHSPVQVEGD
jgi:hypothetical protein